MRILSESMLEVLPGRVTCQPLPHVAGEDVFYRLVPEGGHVGEIRIAQILGDEIERRLGAERPWHVRKCGIMLGAETNRGMAEPIGKQRPNPVLANPPIIAPIASEYLVGPIAGKRHRYVTPC